MKSGGLIRPCKPSDIHDLLPIENASYPKPWTLEQFRQELEETYSHLYVLQKGERIAGYLCFWLAAEEMHILNIATSPEFRRQGVARKLLAFGLQLAKTRDVETACLEVRTQNHSAISLYREFGFVDDCVRPRYYADGEDALLMSRSFKSLPEEGDGSDA